jgi:hypothetical protein
MPQASLFRRLGLIAACSGSNNDRQRDRALGREVGELTTRASAIPGVPQMAEVRTTSARKRL